MGWETLTVPKHGGVLVGPEQLRQVFNDTDAETLWLIVGAPEELEFLPGAPTKPDLSLIYPEAPTELPPELAGKQWPPDEARWASWDLTGRTGGLLGAAHSNLFRCGV